MLKVLYKQTNLGTTILCVTRDVIHSNMAWNLEQTLMISEKNALIIKKKNTKWETSGRRHKLCVCAKKGLDRWKIEIFYFEYYQLYIKCTALSRSPKLWRSIWHLVCFLFVAVVSLGGVWRSTGDAAPLVWPPPPSSSARGTGVVIVH